VRGKAVECMARVELKNIRKVFDKNVVAVDDFNLVIEDKEFVVLVGPSGCGKSTTLRMVAGLEEITEGELYIDDKLVNDVPPKDRDIAMVFQNYALYPHMTVYENMAFALKLRKEKKQVIDKKVKQTAEILGITDLLKRRPKALSGGQRQRVAIGRAIVREPKVFLMDEPLSNLDAKLRNQMRAEIIKIHESVNTTFIYVTHDQTEAMTLGDRIVVMKDGYIQQIGTPQEVFNNPVNEFVAGFIGTPQMNFLDGELVVSNGEYIVNVAGVSIKLPEDKQSVLKKQAEAGRKVTVGVRPEHILVSDAESKDAIKAKIDVCEMMGSETHLHAVVDEKDVIVRIQNVDMNSNFLRGQGRRGDIWLTIPNSLMYLFDKETKRNLFA
jgi:multiple sugar transport system ATP-binding protein